MNYATERELKIYYSYKMGFDYLPKDYETMSRHDQNNAYMVAMWENDNSELEKAINEIEETMNLETGIVYN